MQQLDEAVVARQIPAVNCVYQRVVAALPLVSEIGAGLDERGNDARVAGVERQREHAAAGLVGALRVLMNVRARIEKRANQLGIRTRTLNRVHERCRSRGVEGVDVPFFPGPPVEELADALDVSAPDEPVKFVTPHRARNG